MTPPPKGNRGPSRSTPTFYASDFRTTIAYVPKYPHLENTLEYEILGVEMTGKKVLTVRVSAELQDRLDAIADVIDRPRSWVVNRVLEAFVESEAWQIEAIKRGLAETDVGEFAVTQKSGRCSRSGAHVDPDADKVAAHRHAQP
jgi:predicted transcriptional regulator